MVPDISALNSDLLESRSRCDALAQKVTSLEKQVDLLEQSKDRADDHNRKLTSQIEHLSEQLSSTAHEQTSQVSTLRKEKQQLQSELEEARDVQHKQDSLIQSLKEVKTSYTSSQTLTVILGSCDVRLR